MNGFLGEGEAGSVVEDRFCGGGGGGMFINIVDVVVVEENEALPLSPTSCTLRAWTPPIFPER
jgi:hypothetical protein